MWSTYYKNADCMGSLLDHYATVYCRVGDQHNIQACDVCMYICIYTHVCMQAHIISYMFVYTCVCVCVCVCVCARDGRY